MSHPVGRHVLREQRQQVRIFVAVHDRPRALIVAQCADHLDELAAFGGLRLPADVLALVVVVLVLPLEGRTVERGHEPVVVVLGVEPFARCVRAGDHHRRNTLRPNPPAVSDRVALGHQEPHRSIAVDAQDVGKAVLDLVVLEVRAYREEAPVAVLFTRIQRAIPQATTRVQRRLFRQGIHLAHRPAAPLVRGPVRLERVVASESSRAVAIRAGEGAERVTVVEINGGGDAVNFDRSGLRTSGRGPSDDREPKQTGENGCASLHDASIATGGGSIRQRA